MKLSLWIKYIAPKVGGMLAAVALILAVVALPTLSMVTIYGVIYGDVPNQGKIATICRP